MIHITTLITREATSSQGKQSCIRPLNPFHKFKHSLSRSHPAQPVEPLLESVSMRSHPAQPVEFLMGVVPMRSHPAQPGADL